MKFRQEDLQEMAMDSVGSKIDDFEVVETEIVETS